jgi:signal transduction histidine kinase
MPLSSPRVRDQGRGIPTHKLQSIFERFQQVDASDSRDKGGTGLGLAICRSIVQQHGGAIWVDSIEGKGSEFFVLLPRFQPEDESVVSVPTSRDRALPT